VTGRRMLLGLLGANIMGSLSPALFTDAFAFAGIDGFYHLMDVDRLRERRLMVLLEAAKATGFSGLNITYPFKQDVIPLLDAMDPEAMQVGAVNTVDIAPDGATRGYNFDRRGWRNAFVESFGGDAAKGAMVVMVGAGGAGRAVACALIDLGVAALVIYDADTKRAEALKSELAQHFGTARVRIASDLGHDVEAADGVVNATQTGMRGFPGNPIPISAISSRHWAADVIYTPVDTEFIKAAAAKGCQTMSGNGMCVHQAIEAFRHFTGVTVEVARLHRTFARALESRERAMVKAS
jgi:shikimate dehydrogenase